jgi:hypothetical protein
MRKSIEADDKAAYYRAKAAGVGRAGISSDDPDALVKLREKLAGMEADRELMKRINAAWRKAGRPGAENAEAWAKVGELAGIDEEGVSRLRLESARDFMARAPYTYQLTNLGGNVKRVKERIEALERAAEAAEGPAAEPIKGDGWEIVEVPEDNRVRFFFDRRPTREVCAIMRRNGWRWSRTEGAWQRHLNNAGRHSAQEVARTLPEKVFP